MEHGGGGRAVRRNSQFGAKAPLRVGGPIVGSTTALWFRIEEAFGEIQELCAEAQAAEFVVKAGEHARNVIESFARGATVVEDDEPPALSEREGRAAELAADPGFRESHAEGADLVGLRSRLRKQLSRLKASFAEILSDHDVYFTLFPIVVYADELVNTATEGRVERWEPLQSELYSIDNGGELFFTFLEERLRQEETHPIILEVFYFCLKDGFLGQYSGDKRKIESYLSRLEQRLPVRELPRVARQEPKPIALVGFPARYYLAAAAWVAATYVILSFISPSS